MPNTWVAVSGGEIWNAREGGSVPAVADAIEMSPNDNRKLYFDFGNLREFWDGGGINLGIVPIVSVSGGSATFSGIQAMPVQFGNGTPIGGLLLTLTQSNLLVYGAEPIGAYYVEFWCNSGSTQGSFIVSVTIVLMDGTQLTRGGTLNVG